MFMCFLLVLLAGCQGASRAQDSLAAGMKINAEVRQAFFIKAFTLNRAIITESRQKWINEAKKQTATGVLTAKEIAKIYSFLGISPDFIPNNINKRVNESGHQDKIIDQEIIEKLTDYFTPYIEDLEIYLKISLSFWKLK